MNKFGFNINLKNTPEEILELSEVFLQTKLFEAIEVTYYENMHNVDTTFYNSAINEIVKKYNPQVLVHISAFNLSEENTTIRNAILFEIENCCNYTKQFGGNEIVLHTGSWTSGMHVPIVNLVVGRPTKEEIYEKAWKLSVELMKEACSIAKKYNMIIYTENLDAPGLTGDSRDLNRFLDAVNCDNLKIVFDIGHCNHTGHNVVEDVHIAGNRLKHLHLHDNFGKIDQHLPIGEGTIDFKSFAAALNDVDYTGVYMMELYHCESQNLLDSRERFLTCLQ